MSSKLNSLAQKVVSGMLLYGTEQKLEIIHPKLIRSSGMYAISAVSSPSTAIIHAVLSPFSPEDYSITFDVPGNIGNVSMAKHVLKNLLWSSAEAYVLAMPKTDFRKCAGSSIEYRSLEKRVVRSATKITAEHLPIRLIPEVFEYEFTLH